MKKLIIVLLISILIAVAFADPGDVTITITIPAAKVADFQAGFLRVYPKPADVNGVSPYTDKQWLKKIVTNLLTETYKRGKKRLAIDAALEAQAIDPNIIE